MTVPDAYVDAKYGEEGQTRAQLIDAARKLEDKPKVKARITELLELGRERREEREEDRKDMVVYEDAMNNAEILQGLRTVFTLAIERETIVTKAGDLVEGNPNNLGAANRALELMGKQRGMFADTKIIKNETDHMNIEQLQAAIERVDQLLLAGARKMGDDAQVVEATVIDA